MAQNWPKKYFLHFNGIISLITLKVLSNFKFGEDILIFSEIY